MVHAVYAATAPDCFPELGVRVRQRDAVGRLAARRRLLVLNFRYGVTLQVLKKRPAVLDVDDLDAATDPEDGDAGVPRVVEQGPLEIVPGAVHLNAVIFRLFEIGRAHV